ncbi:alpha/beta fold hydrolase [Microbacterium sp. ET2]|uniref:alpha/beta fold hydrolase n=1 Tax=Microbacterium albipurpureum TaxID=3050384 RepID=UPI00259D0C91|nr:alpha/beta fold hydrolase [Microbacterium sp. ET2 (Ac-2212)]WJL96637.1 alpha/beta fold hydrolase [Microbacterium sp. ET2 (Ac-2212)]
MDYASPEGDTASVALVRIPARGESQGPLLFNPGGPGGAGLLGTMAAYFGLSESPITERFDLVGFDPRGVGATQPAVDCWDPETETLGDEVFESLGTIVPPLTEEETRALADRCIDGSGGAQALENVGTRTTANDMDVLREVLGEEQIAFLGQSYGTRLGTIYAEQFPDRVRAMVLDGAFDPTLSYQERLLTSYRDFQAAFEAMAASCTMQPDCPLGSDPAGTTAAFQDLLQPLAEEPIPAGEAEVDFALAWGGVVTGLYSPASWPTVIDGLRGVQRGDGTLLLELATALDGSSPDGVGSNQSEALMAINCADEPRLTSDELVQLRDAAFEVAPFADPGTDRAEGARDHCADFPGEGGELGTPHGVDIEGLVPTVVVSITGDPTTPHANGIALAETLGSTLVTVEGEGHTVVALGTNPCVDEIASRYLIEGVLPEGDPTCPSS